MDQLLLFTLTSPSLLFRWTGSFLQLLLRSSSLNSDGRAPTIYIDEPFTALQMDGLLPTIPLASSPLNSDGRAPTIYIDELFQTALPDDLSPLAHVAELYSTTHTDEPSPTVPKDELYQPPTIDDLSHKQDVQLKNQVKTCESDAEGHRPNLTNSTYANHTVWEPSQFKQNSIQNFNDAV